MSSSLESQQKPSGESSIESRSAEVSCDSSSNLSAPSNVEQSREVGEVTNNGTNSSSQSSSGRTWCAFKICRSESENSEHSEEGNSRTTLPKPVTVSADVLQKIANRANTPIHIVTKAISGTVKTIRPSTPKVQTAPIVTFKLPGNATPDDIKKIIQAHSSAAGNLASTGGKMKLTPLASSTLLNSTSQGMLYSGLTSSTNSIQSVTSNLSQSGTSNIDQLGSSNFNQSSTSNFNQSVTSNFNQSVTSNFNQSVNSNFNQSLVNYNQSLTNNIIQSGLSNSSVITQQGASGIPTVVGNVLQQSIGGTNALQTSLFQSSQNQALLNNPYAINNTNLILSSTGGVQIAPVNQAIVPVQPNQPMVQQSTAILQQTPSVLQQSPSIVQTPSVVVQPSASTVVMDPMFGPVQLQSNTVVGVPGQGQGIVNAQGHSVINTSPVYQTINPSIAQQQMYSGVGLSNPQQTIPLVSPQVSANYGQQTNLQGYQSQVMQPSSLISPAIRSVGAGSSVSLTTAQPQNTIVRIFVDGKPVAMTTDPSVLQDPNRLMSKITTTKLQSGTYSVSVNAHKVKEQNNVTVLPSNHTPAVGSNVVTKKVVYPVQRPQGNNSGAFPTRMESSLRTILSKPLLETPRSALGPHARSAIIPRVRHSHRTIAPAMPRPDTTIMSTPRPITTIMSTPRPNTTIMPTPRPITTIMSTPLQFSSGEISTAENEAKHMSKVSILGARPRMSLKPVIQSATHTVVMGQKSDATENPYVKKPQSIGSANSGKRQNENENLYPPAKKAFLSVDMKNTKLKPHVLKSIVNKLVKDASKPNAMKKAGVSNGSPGNNENVASALRKKMLMKMKKKGMETQGDKRQRISQMQQRILGPHASGKMKSITIKVLNIHVSV